MDFYRDVHKLDLESRVLLFPFPILHVRSFCWSRHKLSRLPIINRLTQKTQEFYQNRAGEATRASRDSSLSWAWEDLTEANGGRPASTSRMTEAEL